MYEKLKEILSKYTYDLCSVSFLNTQNISCGDSNLFYKLDDLIENINFGMKINVLMISKFRIKFFIKDDKGFKSIAEITITKEEIENLNKE